MKLLHSIFAFSFLLNVVLAQDTSECDAFPAPEEADCFFEGFDITHEDGELMCGRPYRPEFALKPPIVENNYAIPGVLYTLILINATPGAPFAPRTHFGAVNIPGSLLQDGINLADYKDDGVFKMYWRPLPLRAMKLIPQQKDNVYVYEWLLYSQFGEVEVPSANEDYRVVTDGLFPVDQFYFYSSYCVKEDED